METLTKIDNIKNLFEEVEDKKDFIERVSKEFNIAKSTARTGWFTRFEIPKRYNIQDNLISFMQKYIFKQNSGGK
jgi:hypothetical protein